MTIKRIWIKKDDIDLLADIENYRLANENFSELVRTGLRKVIDERKKLDGNSTLDDFDKVEDKSPTLNKLLENFDDVIQYLEAFASNDPVKYDRMGIALTAFLKEYNRIYNKNKLRIRKAI